MYKLIALTGLCAVLTACGSGPKDSYERAAAERAQQAERHVERAIDRAPKWMNELPKSTAAVYANGTATSTDLSMADEKAKTIAFGKICMAAGGEVDKSSKVFRADVGDQSSENSSMAIRSMCRTVDITGAEVVQIQRLAEGNRFRSYVLVALPTGSANALQQRRDQTQAQSQVQRQSEQAWRELDSQGRRPQ